MRKPTLQSLLLAVVLVFGQWLSFAHASSHPVLSAAGDQGCEFCVHVQGGSAGLAVLPQMPLPVFGHEVPVALPLQVVSVAAPAYYAIRGPPLFIA